MLCEAEKRLTCEQIKAHPVSRRPTHPQPPTARIPKHNWPADTRQFFYGVDWATIRDIDAPFVPHLRSITDTSYFPTEDIDQGGEAPQAGEADPDAKKDLAFLGYT
jgi:protein-serine/threonine kinase